MPAPFRVFALLCCSLCCRAAFACTVCDSPNGHALRAGLGASHPLHTLLLVLAPAPVLLSVVGLLAWAMPDLTLPPSPFAPPQPQPEITL